MNQTGDLFADPPARPAPPPMVAPAAKREPPSVCTCCGQRIRKLNPHRIDKMKVTVLGWIATKNIDHEWVKVQRDSHLIPNNERPWTVQTDAIHATRLGWFGLLDLKSRREGMFKINQRGLDFLRGLHRVPELIYCKEGHVIERSEKLVSIHQVKNVILDKDYWDNYPALQKWPGQ